MAGSRRPVVIDILHRLADLSLEGEIPDVEEKLSRSAASIIYREAGKETRDVDCPALWLGINSPGGARSRTPRNTAPGSG